MILDRIENLRLYASLHRGIVRAVAFLEANDLRQLVVARHAIDESRFYVIRDHSTGKTLSGARLEAHRRYIDIQIPLDRPEVIGYSPLADCGQVSQPYDDAKDIEFFAGTPQTWMTVTPGSFALFFPADAHAPLAIDGKIHKAIFKILA